MWREVKKGREERGEVEVWRGEGVRGIKKGREERGEVWRGAE